MIDLKQVKALIKLMVDNELSELDVEAEGEKVKLRRGHGQPVLSYTPPPAAAFAPAPAAPSAPAVAAAPPAAAEDAGLVAIKSPMVGTFYASPTPDAQPFVAVGAAVNDETVVCIIEAMKVFNEIKAEMRGTIVRVMVQNGQAVEFDQPLFMVKPA
jgi:acetyl-CoA carboxylase biotin carboxyl carrier protein